MKNSLPILCLVFLCCGCNLFKPAGEKPADTGDREIGVRVGNIAPNIHLKSPTGRERPLADLRGKMVLVDFWASWCAPCRASSPLLVGAYNNFKGKNFKNGDGFEVYSVSLDNSQNAWLKAIEEDGLAWPNHVSDLAKWDSYAVPLYELKSIPTNVLIDGDGVILQTNVEAHKLEDVLRKYLK